ncbi:MAG: nucleotidyl transferase AbiEii/AbiGii toxin family protein [bacterium]
MKNTIYYAQAKLLIRILPHIAKETVFALKGGTAINYFLWDLPRLSVDVDLTYLPIKLRRESIQEISESLNRIIQGIQYTIPNVKVIPKIDKESKKKIGCIVNRNNITVKIEPNVVIRGSVFPAETVSISRAAVDNFGSTVSVSRLSIPDLFGGKMCAALDRQHPRDLFDIHLLFKKLEFSDDIRKAFVIYLLSHPRPMLELLNPNFKDIKTVFENEFAGMSRISVTLDDLLEAREELVSHLKQSLTENEKRFILSIKRGEPEWSLSGLEGIDTLPAIRWKIKNIKNMDKKKHKLAVDKLEKYLKL